MRTTPPSRDQAELRALFEAIVEGDRPRVTRLVAQSPTLIQRAARVGATRAEARAEPNAEDDSGVAPLHRAVRGRCAAAVRALLAGGADPSKKNEKGSSPLHLAVQTTGRGGSGSEAARAQQAEIVTLLRSHGARPSDRNAAGKTVTECATADWLRALLDAPLRPAR